MRAAVSRTYHAPVLRAALSLPFLVLVAAARNTWQAVDEIRRQHPRDFAWTGTIDRLTGSDRVRLAVESGRLPALLGEWDREAAEFRESRKAFLAY